MINPSSQQTDYSESYYGLCLSYYHLYSQEIGSRRFQLLAPHFYNDSTKLEIAAGYSTNINPEDGIIAAKLFSPFSSTLDWLWRLKCRLFRYSDLHDNTEVGKQSVYKESTNLHKVTKDNSLRSFILSFYQLPDQYAGWIIPIILKVLRKRKKYDFVISTAPPWSSHIAAIFIGWLLGIPVILDDRDPWASSSGRMALITHPLIRNLDKHLAHYCYSKADGIVGVTMAACNLHKENLKNNSIPIGCFPNGYGPILDVYYRAPVYTNEINITYVGSTYHGRSPLIILEAAKILDENIAKVFHFHFIGTISQPEINAINALDKKYKVTIHGFKSHEYCLKAINESDICLLMAIGQPIQIPAKVYDYIGLGRPILSISEPNDATMQLLENKNWAWTIASNNKADLTRLLTDIHQQWKDNNLPQLKQHGEREKYSFKQVADEYSKFIKQVVKNSLQKND